MFTPFNQSRFRYVNGKRVGIVPTGTIVYLQDGLRPLRGFTQPVVRRNPWIVVAWKPRVSSFDGLASSPCDTAVVRSLRDGRTQTVGDWYIMAHDDADLTR